MFFGKKKVEEPSFVTAQKSLKRMNAWMVLALIGIVATSGVVYKIFAANIDTNRDQMSNQATNAASNHNISFNLSGGNTFTAAEEIVVDFPEADFTQQGTWTTADFTFNDGTARVVDAVNAGPGVTTVSCTDGINNLGVAIDTTSLSFRFIPCGVLFTSSLGGAFVNFNIDGDTPDGELLNPPATGSYEITFPDAAGDCQNINDWCKLAVPIVDTNDINVTATVSGGGGGGGGGDTTAPTIFNIQENNSDEDSVEICWDTNEAANGTVNWGPTNTYGSQNNSASSLFTRCVEIGPLVEGQTYHYQVCSADVANNQACSGDLEYIHPDNTAPLISAVSVNSVTCTSANFSWTTNEPATSYVDMGAVAGPPYGATYGNGTLTTSHNVLVTGLGQGVTYHYRVRSGDASSNEAFTSDSTFATLALCAPDNTAPIITNIQENNVTQTTAQICYDTNEIADGRIDFGPTVSYGTTQTDGNYVTTRCFNLTGLTPGTVYHYQLTSKDPAANNAQTGDLTFTTLPLNPGECVVDCANAEFQPYIINPDGTKRKVGSNFVVVTEESPTVTRYNFEDKGSDYDYNDVIVRVNHADCSSVIFEAELGDAAWHHVIRAEVFYEGEVRQDELLWPDSQTAEGAPRNISFAGDANMCEGTPPSITNITVTEIGENRALISWDTLGSPSDSVVDFGVTDAYGQTLSVNENVTNHSVVVTGLQAGTLYHFRVSSTDNQNRSAVSTDQTFTTLTDNVAPANVSDLTATPGNAVVNLTWNNPPDADFVGVKLLRKTTGYPTNSTDGVLVYQGTSESHLDTTVTNGVLYYYAVFAYDEVPNYSSGAVTSATPTGEADVTPPGNVTSLTATAGTGQVLLQWNNPTDPDFVAVKLVRKLGSNPTNPTDGILVYQGNGDNFLDTGLTNGTQYFYGVFSYDAVPNYSSGAFANATPFADVTPPAPVTNLVAEPGNAQVLLTWQNPVTGDWAGTRVVRKTGGYPTSPTDGMIVFDGVGQSQMDNFVTNGTRYYYAAYAYDASGNFAPPAQADATPRANLPPPEGPRCVDSDGGRNYDTGGTVTFENSTKTDNCHSGTELNEMYCENDSQKQEKVSCGDGYKCSQDRCVPLNFVPTDEICGNGTCGGDENTLNCSADCPLQPTDPAAEVPDSTVAPGMQMEGSDLRFIATTGHIQLRLSNGDMLRFYNSAVFTVMIPDPSIQGVITEAFVNFNGRAYIMRQTASFEATIITPEQIGFYPMDVVVKYEDGSTDSVHVTVQLVERPFVYEDADGQNKVAGARVTLLQDMGGGNYGVFDGAKYGQQNPQTTDENGRFAYIVPIGSYKLRVEKEGYRTKETLPFPNNTDNVLLTNVALIPLPPPDDPLAQAEYLAKVAADALKELTDNAYVEQGAQDIAAPAVTIATVANVATAGLAAGIAFPWLLSLYSLLSHPFMLIARRRRKQWGIVYNSLSKLPIDLVIVRLLDATSGKILRSAVTDKEGRFFFIVQAGSYRIVAVKANYVFPSDTLRGQKEDNKYVDLYHGEVIAVTKETVLTPNIPLDPIGAEKTPARIKWEAAGRRFQKSISILTILAIIGATVINPSPLMFVLLAVNVMMFFIFRRLAVTSKPKNWGIVYDEKSKRPIQNVVARIFDARYNKLLETQMTDARGRYAFLVGQNQYYVTFEKLGYEKKQKGPVDLIEASRRAGEAAKLVAVDVPLVYTGKKSGGMPPAALVTPAVPPPAPVVPPAAPAPVAPPAPTPKSPAAAGSYAEQMMKRLGGAGAAPAAPAAPSGPTETPQQIVKDLKDEASGARNGHELPPGDVHDADSEAK